jgi:hypothetical protein
MRFISLHFRRICKIVKWFWASSCLSVHPYVCPHVTIQLPPDGFSLNLIFDDFSKSVENIQVRHKSDKINGYCTRGPMYLFNNILSVFKLVFMTATRHREQVRIGLWRVRSVWKIGYWTAVWRLLHKQQEKSFLECYESLSWSGNLSAMETHNLATVYNSFQIA